jgi:ParB family chromosome partitioning protein
MPKLTSNNTLTFKISIDQIIETGNVRTNYDDEKIKELSESIFKYGLINPISVKPLPDSADGIKQYELVAGHRRLRAFRLLCSQGQDYSQITASVVTKGSKNILQLVENVQREDLEPVDVETAIKAMVTAGMSQKEISEELSKSLSWVHDRLAGTEVRENAEARGIDTTGMTTKALSQLASVPGEQLPNVIAQAQANGGTVKAATDALNDFRIQNNIEKPKNRKKEDYLDIPELNESKPILIDIENVISEIQDYFKRQLEGEEGLHRINTLNKIKDDLIALFEAYQHN